MTFHNFSPNLSNCQNENKRPHIKQQQHQTQTLAHTHKQTRTHTPTHTRTYIDFHCQVNQNNHTPFRLSSSVVLHFTSINFSRKYDRKKGKITLDGGFDFDSITYTFSNSRFRVQQIEFSCVDLHRHLSRFPNGVRYIKPGDISLGKPRFWEKTRKSEKKLFHDFQK